MRLVEEGFGESIPAAVIGVYSVGLTVPGELSLRGVTHLEPLPKILTSLVSHQVQGILTGRGLPKCRPISASSEWQLSDPESSHLKKILLNFGQARVANSAYLHRANGAKALRPISAEREGVYARQGHRASYPCVHRSEARRPLYLLLVILWPSLCGETYRNRYTSIWVNGCRTRKQTNSAR